MKVTHRIRLILIIIIGFALTQPGVAQSKLYIAAGASSVFGSGTNILLGTTSYGPQYNFYAFDLEYEKRIIGSFNFVTGASMFNAGYATEDASFSSASDFTASYVAVPLLARWNPGHRSIYFIDFGLTPFYLVNAHLTESITRFNSPVTVEGDITRYSQRFYFGYKIQFLALLNRFQFGFYILLPLKGQSTLKGLEGHWGLNAQESTYLLSNGFSDYKILGVKIGVRIK